MNSIVNKVYADTLSEFLSDRISSDADGRNGLFAVSGEDALGQFVSNIIGIALPLAGVAAVVLLTVAGYKMITSQGNPDKLNDAKEMITNAVIGFVFILLSVTILLFMASIFNISIAR